ncbi:MAG: NADH-quinone oxidoreductase subunit A [Coriobacteriia bacterium]|nr:NADH-quinone oxidoreductase subunit A [Coriobacteriia bacterium]
MDATNAGSVLFVLGLGVAATAFIGIVFLANTLLSPRNPTADKVEPYECGMPQAGPPWARVNLRFATIAVLFVLFDAEAILLFAIAPALRGSLIGMIEAGLFAGFLALGLMYAWRKGALQWRS